MVVAAAVTPRSKTGTQAARPDSPDARLYLKRRSASALSTRTGLRLEMHSPAGVPFSSDSSSTFASALCSVAAAGDVGGDGARSGRSGISATDGEVGWAFLLPWAEFSLVTGSSTTELQLSSVRSVSSSVST